MVLKQDSVGAEHCGTRVERLLLIAFLFPNRLAPYERRVIELLRNSKDKRARKLAKKRVRVSFPAVPTTTPYTTY